MGVLMKNSALIIGGVALLAVGYFLILKKRGAVPGALPVGATTTLSHAPDSSSGGIFSSIASLAAGGLAKVLPGATSATPDNNSPFNLATLTNPVATTPAVLPNSYKQTVVDNPSLLESDDLFTPSYDSGSSGSYMDDTDSFGDNGF
jgi:hypothetical protein